MIFDGDLKEGLARFADMVAKADVVLPFTGAGISTECGIPDFRSPGGLWSQNKPIPFETYMSSREARIEAWRRRFELEAVFGPAKPGRGHIALAGLVASGKAPAIVTQNIDNLHQTSGVPPEKVVEIHGNTTYALCMGCQARHEISVIRAHFESDGAPPDCAACGGILKTGTISFGQAMPAAQMRRAVALSRSCDLFISVGSSLVVYPAAGLPAIAKESGSLLVIINREPTSFDAAADLVLRGDIGDVLERIK